MFLKTNISFCWSGACQVVGWLGARTVGQLWACPSITHTTPGGNSKEDPEIYPWFSRFLLSVVALGAVDSGYGYSGILTSFFFLTPSHPSYPALLSTLLPCPILSRSSHASTPPLHRYGLGVCFLRSGRLEFAKVHLEKAVEVHPRNAIILKALGEVSCLCGYFPSRGLAKGDA